MEASQQEELLAAVEKLQQENLILRQQLAHVLKQLYGSKSEKLDASQLALFEEDEKPEASAEPEAEVTNEGGDAKKSKPRPRREARLPDNLPTRSETIIPAEVLADPDQWRCMGEDISTRLELEPGYMYLLKTIRPKYVPVDHPFQAPVQQPAPPALIPGGFLGNDLLSEVITNRYLYALPFYRQEQMFSQRYHIDLPRSTMSDATASAARALEPLCTVMKQEMLKSGYVGTDETPVRFLGGETKGSTQGYYWVYRNANGEVLFDWQTDRRHHHLADFLGDDFRGIIQSDGYEAYQNYCRSHEGVQRASCMAHIRRKFVEALDSSPEIVNWLLRIIGRLYALESMLRKYEADAETRARVRRSHSAPILKLLHKAVKHLQTKSRILSKSNLGKALGYAIGQLPAMYVYLEYGEVEIDNNLVENAIRPTAVGKKNHLFIGSPEAGGKSAVLYSLLLSAKACGVPPQQYLRDVMERLPLIRTWDDEALLELTPARWAAVWHAGQKAQKESSDVA